jgi:hypothetical protein
VVFCFVMQGLADLSPARPSFHGRVSKQGEVKCSVYFYYAHISGAQGPRPNLCLKYRTGCQDCIVRYRSLRKEGK